MEKIKTIGDGYMAVAASAVRSPIIASASHGWRWRCPASSPQLSKTHDVDLRVRIGIASGPVMAGVIGADKFSYDVWGETVNLAARLELHGLPGEIQVSADVRDALGEEFLLTRRGTIPIKGVGMVETWFLIEDASAGRDAGA